MTADQQLAAIRAAIQIDPGNRGLAPLFPACRDDFAAACRSLMQDDGAVAIFTGFYIPTATPPASETDGPLGAVVLATALAHLGRQVLLFTDIPTHRAVEIGLELRGVQPDGRAVADRIPSDGRVLTKTLPGPSHPWFAYLENEWTRSVADYRIRHAVAIECPGPSRHDGRFYSMRGRDITDRASPVHHLFEECHRATPRVRTLGVGDGGNEIGMGKLAWGDIARHVANGEKIACRVPTDHLVMAGVSNWGGYALAAGIYVLGGQCPPDDLFDAARERQILEAMVCDGPLVDGVTGQQTPTVDGLAWKDYAEPLKKIRDIVGD